MDKRFSASEIGLSHPIRNTAIRLMDDGRICILAGNGCGIVLDTDTGYVTIYGKEINLSTEELKVNGNHVDKELISNTAIRSFLNNETSGAITSKLIELQEKEK